MCDFYTHILFSLLFGILVLVFSYNRMRTIIKEFLAGMDNIYNSFFISFFSLRTFQERPILSDYLIPINGFNYNTIQAAQINRLGEDSIVEYINSIRRHALNDIVICYERYATQMYISHINNNTKTDPASQQCRNINSNNFEKLNGVYTEVQIEFFQQLKRLRNSIVHYNGVYNKANPLSYSFADDTYNSVGHEGECITIQLDTIVFIYDFVLYSIKQINESFFNLYCNQ